jgi:hypothetical protein
MRLTNASRALVIVLVAYVVLDILLTPVARIETRPVSHVTGLGFVTLGLLFAGLALSIVSLVLVFRGSRRAALVAIIAAVLFFPAPLAELTGNFSSLRPPTGIAWIEVAQTVVAVIAAGIGIWMLRIDTTRVA